MRMYVDDTGSSSPSVGRVVGALKKYAPEGTEFVEQASDADFVVYHVYGRHKQIVDRIRRNNCPYAVIQFTLRGSRTPSTSDWLPIWKNAAVVWSYLDLRKAALEDRNAPDFNFYYAPLGVESVFKHINIDKRYTVCTSGMLYMTESVRECYIAARSIGGLTAHLGPRVATVSDMECFSGISDEELTNLYNRCDYVSGLRRTEGFELPAAEALCCGVRPILFDAPHYRQWYDTLGIFIQEGSRDSVINDLQTIFRTGYRKEVSDIEIQEARERFDWSTLVSEFYARRN